MSKDKKALESKTEEAAPKKKKSSFEYPFKPGALGFDLIGADMDVPPDIMEELGDEYDFRWICLNQLEKAGGNHRRYWVPYANHERGTVDNDRLRYGVDPDGLVRRHGNLVLAVRPKELGRKHKALLKELAQANKGIVSGDKRAASELKEQAREAGHPDVNIFSGYEEK